MQSYSGRGIFRRLTEIKKTNITQKRREIKGKVIQRNLKDKVGNAFGFRANIVLIPISTKSRSRKDPGRLYPRKEKHSAKEASGGKEESSGLNRGE